MELSVLSVTNGLDYGHVYRVDMMALAKQLGAEMVFAADGEIAHERLTREFPEAVVVLVKSKGYMESVLDDGVTACTGEYILRLDDDERCSPQMAQWLAAKEYRKADHWSFPRFHLWGDGSQFVITKPYFPDWQIRLSVKAKAGGRPQIHQGSPFGYGSPAPVGIEHYELISKSLEFRAKIAMGYYRVAGTPCTWEQALKSQPEMWDTPPELKPYKGGLIKVRNI